MVLSLGKSKCYSSSVLTLKDDSVCIVKGIGVHCQGGEVWQVCHNETMQEFSLRRLNVGSAENEFDPM